MNILITGANGYLGSHITENLSAEGHKIYALCLDVFDEQARWEQEGIQIIQADITDTKCYNLFSNLTIDAIIHLVSLNHFDSEKDIENATKVNVLPTWNLLDYFSKRGLKKFIYFSTQQVYGRIPPVVIDELYPPAPVNNYGLTHFLSEKIVDKFNSTTHTEAINVRLSNSYGSPVFKQNSCWWLVVNDLCQSAFFNKEIKLLSDGSPQRDFIHVSDVANAIQLLVEKGKLEYNLFNISSGTTYTILELAILVRKVYFEMYKEEIPIVGKDNNKIETDTAKQVLKSKIDPGRLKKVGFGQEVLLEGGIRSLFDYLKDN